MDGANDIINHIWTHSFTIRWEREGIYNKSKENY